MRLTAVADLTGPIGKVAACTLVGQSRATAHRRAKPVVSPSRQTLEELATALQVDRLIE